MTPKRREQIERLYHAALGRAPDERGAFLVEACGDDVTLRLEVESLLASDESKQPDQAPPGGVVADMVIEERMQSAVGHKLGSYKIISPLGKGGMGEVYLAQDTNLGRKVALKLLSQRHTLDHRQVDRFKQEARAASALNHPNISTIFEIGHVDDVHFIAMEFVDGETLRRHLANKNMSLRDVLDVAIQTAQALEASHRSGIAHRDIKPENIMIRRDGYVKVLDFGLAKLLERHGDSRDPQATIMAKMNTSAGMVMGTPSYMSPEQARGLPVDTRTDIFSLGEVIYEMVSGSAAFEGELAMDVLASLLEREPPPLACPSEELPAELQRIVTKALRKDREDRYQTITDLVVDLRNLRDELQFEARLESSTSPEGAGGAARVTNSGRAREGIKETTALSGGVATASSAEFRIGEIRHYKFSAALVGAALLVAVAGLAYFLYFAKSGRAPVNSVAVLPFVNVSNDPDTQYLSDGISESLINSLSRLPELKVSARSSSFKYRGKDVDPQEAAKSLGVMAIVTGRVLQRGDQLQVSVEIADTRDKTQMWGDQYTRKVQDLPAVQAEISQQIVEKLRLRLTNAEHRQLDKDKQANPQAYDLLIKGRFYLMKLTPEDSNKAIEYFKQAVAIDPNYALAYAALAGAYLDRVGNSYLDPEEGLPLAKAAASKAVSLDESLATTHIVAGRIDLTLWDWAGAERELKRAVELGPNLAEAHTWYSLYLTDQGRHDQAIVEVKQARDLFPLNLVYTANMGLTLYYAREYDQAIEQLKKALELDPNFGFANLLLGYVYAAKGTYKEAVAEYRKAIKLRGYNTSDQCYLGYALAKAGERREAEAILRSLEKTREYVSPGELAALYAGLGEKKQALESLQRAVEARDPQMQYLKVERHYDSLRSEPGFQQLMQRVGLVQ